MLFKLENYTNEWDCMHCDTEEKASIFCKFLRDNGRTWNTGESYDEEGAHWNVHKANSVYYFNKGCYGDITNTGLIRDAIKVLEFDDFEFKERKDLKMENEKINIDEVKEILGNAALNATQDEINKIKRTIEIKEDELIYYEQKIKEYEHDEKHKKNLITEYASNISIQKVCRILSNIKDSKSEEGYMLYDLSKPEVKVFGDFTNILNVYINDVYYIENFKNSMETITRDLEDDKKQLKELENKPKEDKASEIEHIIKECETISNNKLIAKIKVTPNGVLVYTNELYATFDYYGETYKARVGKFEINIPYTQNSSDITIFNMNDDDKRSSYWTCNDNHPHVGSSGHACFGNCSALIAQGYQDNSLYETVVAVLLFLQQADTEDLAGKCVVNWDCYHMDGTPADLDEFCTRCSDCGAIIDEDDGYMCEDCGKILCEDCQVYVSGADIYVCNDCFDNNYSRCERCGDNVRIEDIREIEGDYICDYCYDDLLNAGQIVMCENCGDYIYADNAISTINGHYCSDCFNDLDEEEKDRLLGNEKEEESEELEDRNV